MDYLTPWLYLAGLIVVQILWTLAIRTFPEVLGASFVGRIQHKYNLKLEQAKAELQASYSTLESSVHFLSSSQAELRSKTIESAEVLWRASMAAKNEFSDAVFIHQILTPEEIVESFETKDRRLDQIVGNYRDMENFHQKFERVNEHLTDQERLFAGDRLWLIFFYIRAIHGRVGFLVSKSYADGCHHDWRRDSFFGEHLERVLPRETISKSKSERIGGLGLIIAHLEAEFLKEATRVMSGSNRLAESLSDIEATISHTRAEIENRRVASGKKQV